jgi:hypothetical protein
MGRFPAAPAGLPVHRQLKRGTAAGPWRECGGILARAADAVPHQDAGYATDVRPADSATDKSFLLLFFKKEDSFFLCRHLSQGG